MTGGYMFKRKVYNELLEWKEKYADRSACLAFGKNCTSSKIMADLDTIKLIPVTVCNRKKNISKSEISLNTSNNSVDILEKSINIKLSYSFFANSKAIVLLPTRLAPSNKQADRSYIFLSILQLQNPLKDETSDIIIFISKILK